MTNDDHTLTTPLPSSEPAADTAAPEPAAENAAPEPAADTAAPEPTPFMSAPTPVAPAVTFAPPVAPPEAPPTAAPPGYGPTFKKGPRIGIILWGVIVTLIGVSTMAMSTGWRVDATILLVCLLLAAGATILVGSVLGALRSRDRSPS
ncbi:MAG: hypothetical protein FWD59_02245 [Micrococcales bacterium]|nr:hypothetical protein [Micrococcales bacterium]